MPEKHIYEYAVIRVVPSVEREEFMNIGLILFCKKTKFIKMKYAINEKKLSLFYQKIDIQEIEKNLQSFENIAHGNKCASPIALMDIPSRFRWLTAMRSSSIQTSRPHPGICKNLEKTTQKLFEELVL